MDVQKGVEGTRNSTRRRSLASKLLESRRLDPLSVRLLEPLQTFNRRIGEPAAIMNKGQPPLPLYARTVREKRRNSHRDVQITRPSNVAPEVVLPPVSDDGGDETKRFSLDGTVLVAFRVMEDEPAEDVIDGGGEEDVRLGEVVEEGEGSGSADGVGVSAEGGVGRAETSCSGA